MSTQQHYAEWLLSHPGRRLSNDPDMSVRRSWNVLLSHSAMKYPDVKCRRTEFSGYEMSRVTRLSGSTPSGIPQEDMRAMLSCSREHHTPDDNISYPDMVSGWETLTKVSKPCYSPRSATLQWCVRTLYPGILLAWIPKNSPQSHIALVIKKLSKHQNLTHFLLDLIARVLNMSIELKSDNYYSKVFKRVSYKLWNSTFWVVIIELTT